MVRTEQKSASEDKKESTTKKRAPQKKKGPETGAWPCKISGCNKQFAREADLKRHQRTTKLHSLPGFACPQCDATFTRTDALRRHQKSRHNGVIIDPPEHERPKPGVDDEAGSSGSKSRSVTPSRAQAAKGHPPSGQPGGPSSYYRQHTMDAPIYSAQGMIMDPHHYPPALGLPTSAARMGEGSWQPPQWPEGQPGPMGSMPYHQLPPGRYFPPTLEHITRPMYPSGVPDSAVDPSLSQPESNDQQATDASSPEGHRENAAPVIDPSLDSSNASSPKTIQNGTVTHEITQAALEAVIESAQRESRALAASESASPPAVDSKPESSTSNDNPANGEKETSTPSGEANDEENDAKEYDSNRPPPMEQMLTEDGEPMLNPAELLTQESLASPPPS